MTELRDNLDRIGWHPNFAKETWAIPLFDWIVSATQEIERLQARVNKLTQEASNDST